MTFQARKGADCSTAKMISNGDLGLEKEGLDLVTKEVLEVNGYQV